MPEFVPVVPGTHAGLRWLHFSSYAFCAQVTAVPLVASELSAAMLALPLALMRQGDQLVPVAVLGVADSGNLLVASDSGRWQGSHVPAAFRGYPFGMARDGAGRAVLGVDMASGLVGHDPNGERFFEPSGEMSAPLRKVTEFLAAVEADRPRTLAICAALEEHKLLVAWTPSLTLDGRKCTPAGLLTIDDAALAALPDAAFLSLRQSGALKAAFCLSAARAQLWLLEALATRRAQQQAADPTYLVAAASTLDLSALLPKGE